ncbi:soluble lytic murein transglycosylase [Hasllibacter halocynthiae]|uniref:Soluble lytic murein transglycosylase n=1 Tax=Hasllibacter halocynthiae TaxID=595589 RepID=A0A2T0X1X5_9RHOB|nr:lytic transglycosylase domain-containing protein [Hasllibacter halocynthiae]PRY92917.1 soluble lytic murein transglycosylase [Hasllibacter halocynthiae]
MSRALAIVMLCLGAAPLAAQDLAPVSSLRPEARGEGPSARVASMGTQAPARFAGAALERAMEHVRARRWGDALSAAGGDGTAARDVVLWHALRARQGTWDQAADFVARNGEWPGMPLLKARAERLMPAGLPAAEVLRWFEDHEPQTATGALRYAAALREAGEAEAADAVLAIGWSEGLPMSPGTERQYLFAAGDILDGLHEARMDALLWAGHSESATRQMARVGEGWQALARARMALRAGQRDGVNALIAAVPGSHADDAGLAYERFVWRLDRGLEETALDLMLERSDSAERLGRPELWSEVRLDEARALMIRGEARDAYRMASRHRIPEDTEEGVRRATLEWLAGYVALRQLGDAETALRHFREAARTVETPVSVARMGYWQGRALDALGRADEAREAYAAAARFQTAFYGQLAAEAAGLPVDPALAGDLSAEDGALPDTDMLGTVELLLAAGERRLAARFVAHLAESQDRAGMIALGEWVQRRDPYLEVIFGKRAARYGAVLPEFYFPVHPMAEADIPIPTEMALAVARQESEFHPGAGSPVGAQGLMQLMPGTAQDVTRDLGLSYSHARLTSDPEYNATLGAEYLRQLEARFGFNVPMIAAGYNAGPGRPLRWARPGFDPRGATVEEAVDWVERIPFDETRNYVMRVTEGMGVYRQRLAGEPVPLSTGEMLTGR